MPRIVRVTAPHYCAGFEVVGGGCVRPAPILGWVRGKEWEEVAAYFRRKGFVVEVIDA